MRNVTMVVPVLMTSCQVSEKSKSGPVIAQTTITVTARMNAQGDPVASDVALAKDRKRSLIVPPTESGGSSTNSA